MKADFIIPFVDAVSVICEQITGKSAFRGELSVTKELFTSEPVNIVCGISGDLEGIALFGLSKEMAMKLAAMTLNSELRVFDQSVTNALIDLGTKISEKSSEALSKMGFQFDLTPAALIRGTSIHIPTFDVPSLIVPLTFKNLGTILVKLSVRLNQVAQAA